MHKKASLYKWCCDHKLRPTDVKDEDSFMLDEVSYKEFELFIEEAKSNYRLIYGELPNKPEKYLEYKMYGLVPYNISDTQKGIQFDHAKDNYVVEYGTDVRYKRFLEEWKTTIILNGGTSNEGHTIRHGFRDITYIGTMQEHLITLKNNNIKVSTFYEPDLNSMLSAIVFLVDERVFNKKLYPDFTFDELPENVSNLEASKWEIDKVHSYQKWVSLVGGESNVFLREFLKDMKLA
jgi:hypothetical protein